MSNLTPIGLKQRRICPSCQKNAALEICREIFGGLYIRLFLCYACGDLFYRPRRDSEPGYTTWVRIDSCPVIIPNAESLSEAEIFAEVDKRIANFKLEYGKKLEQEKDTPCVTKRLHAVGSKARIKDIKIEQGEIMK